MTLTSSRYISKLSSYFFKLNYNTDYQVRNFSTIILAILLSFRRAQAYTTLLFLLYFYLYRRQCFYAVGTWNYNKDLHYETIPKHLYIKVWEYSLSDKVIFIIFSFLQISSTNPSMLSSVTPLQKSKFRVNLCTFINLGSKCITSLSVTVGLQETSREKTLTDGGIFNEVNIFSGKLILSYYGIYFEKLRNKL